MWCEYWKGLRLEPAYSFYVDIHGVLDYIWFQGDSIIPIKSLDLPDFYRDLPFSVAPNIITPSDHLPLMTEFIIV